MLYDILADDRVVKFHWVFVREIVVKLASLRFNQIGFIRSCSVVKFVSGRMPVSMAA